MTTTLPPEAKKALKALKPFVKHKNILVRECVHYNWYCVCTIQALIRSDDVESIYRLCSELTDLLCGILMQCRGKIQVIEQVDKLMGLICKIRLSCIKEEQI